MSEGPIDFERHRAKKLNDAVEAIAPYLNTFCVAIYKREVSLNLVPARSSVRNLVFEIQIQKDSEWFKKPEQVTTFLYERLEEDIDQLLPDYEADPVGLLDSPPVLIVKKRDSI